MSRFRRVITKMGPRWLVGEGEGERVAASLGTILDAFLERLRLGLLARFPQHCPPDALAYHARDRKIVRGIEESSEAFATRLLRWLDDHRVRGNPYALMEQLRAYCNADVRIRTVDRRGNWFTLERDGSRGYNIAAGNWDWDGVAASPDWSRFWVIIYPTVDGLPWTRVKWGSFVWGAAGKTLASSASRNQVADVRRIVREWKPAGTKCEFVIVAFNDSDFSPTGASPPLPDGTWGRAKKVGSDPAVFSRDDEAIYWIVP